MGNKIVYVLMCNDYPVKVYLSEIAAENARDYHKSISDNYIYYRVHEIEYDDHIE